MLIRCWGARGSIPVSGPQYLKYGGNTTCMEIRTKDDDIVIIDAGSGIRGLGNRLLEEGRFTYTLLFTHGHWDHIMGFPFFKPLHDEKTRIDVYGCPFARQSIKELIAPSMSPPSFPIRIDDIKAGISYNDFCAGCFSVGSLSVCTVNLSHPNQGIGYRITEGGRSFVFLTDNELRYRHPGGRDYGDYAAFAKGADLLIHDGEYTAAEYPSMQTWGHTAYPDALALALEAGAKQLGLFHHNQDRFDEAVDAMVEDCRGIVAERGSALEVIGVQEGMEFSL